MASRNQATPSEVAVSETAMSSWLPDLSGLSPGELSSLDSMVLESSVKHLRLCVNQPLSTIGGSNGS